MFHSRYPFLVSGNYIGMSLNISVTSFYMQLIISYFHILKDHYRYLAFTSSKYLRR